MRSHIVPLVWATSGKGIYLSCAQRLGCGDGLVWSGAGMF